MKKMNVNSMFIQKFGMPLILLGIIVALQLFNLDVALFSWANIENTLLQNTAIALTALGLSLIMISGEGDMSFAGMFSLLTVIFALTANRFDSLTLSFLIVIAVALAANVLIAFFVTKLNFSSFIVSIAVMFMAGGLEKFLHQQTTLVNNEAITSFIDVSFGLPLIVWAMFILYGITFLIVTRTKAGFNLRVTGENIDVGIEAGMNTKMVKFVAYLAAAVLLAVGASFEASRVGAIFSQGEYYMLPVFAACYLGSSMFVPGRVNILGTLVGALFVGLINNFMKMMNVSTYLIPIVQGSILVASVAISVYRTRAKITQVKV